MSIYLPFAIGRKGGVSVPSYGPGLSLLMALVAGIVPSAALPVIAYALLSLLVRLDSLNAPAVAAHYGSISVVSFVAGTSVLEQ